MYYVRLLKPIPTIRSEIFVFYNELEAEEFQSCIHAQYPDAQTESGTVGEPTEIFESWSF